MDPKNSVIFSRNPKREVFELSRSSYTNAICYGLTGFNFLFMCAASYVFLGLKMNQTNWDLCLAMHLTILTTSWYALLFRTFYTMRAKEPVELMNSAILLEKRYFRSKLPYSFHHTKLIIIIITTTIIIVVLLLLLLYRIQSRGWITLVPVWNYSDRNCVVCISDYSCRYRMLRFRCICTSNNNYGCFYGL